MADVRITDLPLIVATGITNTDVLPIVEVELDETKKIEVSQFKNFILDGLNFNPLYIVPSGETVVVQENEQYLIYGDLTIDGGVLTNYGQIIIFDGDLNIVDGEFNDFGQVLFIDTEGSILITYNQLNVAINTSNLISNKSYIIYDFQTIYDQPDFDLSGNPKSSVITKIGPFEPLLIKAVSESTISQDVNSLIYPNDIIKYDWTWGKTEVMGEPAKGRITERIDEYNNRTDYDLKNVLFKRYETSLGSGIFTELNDNGNPSQEFKTFQTEFDSYSNNNFISNYANLNITKPFLLSNNIFGLYSERNELVGVFTNNTIGDYFRYNVSNTEIDKIDFTTATHVYGTYNCTLFENAGGTKVLSFFDASNILTITNINS